MTLTYFFLTQLTAHILTDYLLQTDKLAAQKDKLGFKSSFLKYHALIAGISAWLLFPSVIFLPGAAFIGITHFLLDGFKNTLWKRRNIKPYAFFLDHTSHLLVITLVVIIYHFALTPLPLYSLFPDYLPFVFSLIFVAKPSNIIIRELFKIFDIPSEGTTKELLKGGRVIGVLERWLVLIFIWSTHFEAIGFLIAAKSILRYKDTDTLKTEYVLIGTMLSFGIALILGLISPMM